MIRRSVVVVLVALLGAAAVAGEVRVRRVALTGEPAVDAGPGVTYRIFSEGYAYPHPPPRIDEQGRVAFFAFVTGTGVDATNDTGVWSEAGGTLQLVSRAGQPAPGTEAGTLYDAFPDDIGPAPPGCGGGQTGFSASLTGAAIDALNDEGVWALHGANTLLLARDGDPAPGLDPGVVFRAPALTALSAAGDTLFGSSLNGPTVTGDDDEAYWSDRGGSVGLVVREGDPAPGTGPGVVFGAGEFLGTPYTFQQVRFNAASEFAVQGNLLGPGVDNFSNEALFAERGGALQLIVREGDPAPGAGQGVTFGGNSVVLKAEAVSFNANGRIAFTCRLGGSIPTTSALYSDHGGSLAPVVIEGDVAPGTGDVFSWSGSPLLSDDDSIAFRALLSGSSGTELWWDRPGSLTPLVRGGDPVPGRPAGTTFVSVFWLDGFTPRGEVVFRAKIDDPTTTSSVGLVVADGPGSFHVLAKIGEPFDVAGDGSDVRTVDQITVGGVNDRGEVAFRLDFTDGSQGIFEASLALDAGAASALRIERNGDGTLTLSWAPDCGAGNVYGVYRGDLASGYGSLAPEPGQCAVTATSATIPEGPGPADFFLVVPSRDGFEGSYGFDGSGTPRPPAPVTCHPQGPTDGCAP